MTAFPTLGTPPSDPVHPALLITGERARWRQITGRRQGLVLLAAMAGFGLIILRLMQLGLAVPDTTIEGRTRDMIQASRPDIVDRNGIVMAVDISVPSLFAEPRRISDVPDTVDKLRTVLPDLDRNWLLGRLSGNSGFVWIRRELTPALKERIMGLGLPGIDFINENRRFYPGGAEASHVIGTVDIDNRGTAGVELALDREYVEVLHDVGLARGQSLEPVELSIDMRVQHVMRQELVTAIGRFRAIAGAGVMIDVRTGEVVALVSLPDFDPNVPASALEKDALNRITAGSYELGSTFKTVTIAAALDGGSLAIDDLVDAREGVRFGRFVLDHGKHRILSVPEIFRFSDNIGTIRIMQAMGKEAYRRFLSRAGFDTRSPIELPERAMPSVPAQFSDVGAATASYGYGFAATPLHMASAVAALANSGMAVPPTIFARTAEEASALAVPIVSPQTSREIRYLLRLNAVEGSGRRMERIATGFHAGGKTGTAEKVVNGQYSKTLNLTVFAAVFPIEEPRFALLVMLDEAKAETETGSREAGWNTAEVAGKIIQRTAPMLGLVPQFDARDAAALTLLHP